MGFAERAESWRAKAHLTGVRLPLVDATPEQSERLAATMREVGVL